MVFLSSVTFNFISSVNLSRQVYVMAGLILFPVYFSQWWYFQSWSHSQMINQTLWQQLTLEPKICYFSTPWVVDHCCLSVLLSCDCCIYAVCWQLCILFHCIAAVMQGWWPWSNCRHSHQVWSPVKQLLVSIPPSFASVRLLSASFTYMLVHLKNNGQIIITEEICVMFHLLIVQGGSK